MLNFQTCRTGRIQLPQTDVFNERYMVLRMPVFAVKNCLKLHSFQHFIDGCYNLFKDNNEAKKYNRFVQFPTSYPLWPDGHPLNGRLPVMKSFWTSTTTNAGIGWTI